MTVRATQLVFAANSVESNLIDVLRHEPLAIDILAESPQVSRDSIAIQFVRHIMRDRDCSKIPEVVGLVGHPTNQWGDNFQIEVIYDRQWHAIYAGRVQNHDFRIVEISCYID